MSGNRMKKEGQSSGVSLSLPRRQARIFANRLSALNIRLREATAQNRLHLCGDSHSERRQYKYWRKSGSFVPFLERKQRTELSKGLKISLENISIRRLIVSLRFQIIRRAIRDSEISSQGSAAADMQVCPSLIFQCLRDL